MNRTERAKRAVEALRSMIKRPETELEYRNPFELLISVILSAQCTDDRVNKVTPALFERYPDAETLAAAEVPEVFSYIRSISYPNNKAKHLVAMAGILVERYDGAVPETIDGLLVLPGVGRKTAQVVASVAFGVPAFPVDTHVFRVANRIGITHRAPTPAAVERQVKRLLKPEEWGEAHHLFILHGRYTCTARNPACGDCGVQPVCRFHERRLKLPAARESLSPRRGRHYCGTCRRYFEQSGVRKDRHGIEQAACPSCRSMNVFDSRTGRSMKQIPDYRV